MKKSHLIFLLCLLFCGQMFAQRPMSNTPTNPKNPDAPVIADTNGEPPIVPCEGVSYDIEIQNVVWDADIVTLTGIIDAKNIKQVNLGDLPASFNIAVVQMTHPKKTFKEYSFDIDVNQSGSFKPIVLLFVYTLDTNMTPLYEDGTGTVTGFKIESTGTTGGGGVATAIPVEGLEPQKCISITTQGKQLVFQNEESCFLNNSSGNFCDQQSSNPTVKW